jgi:hypothetical protein
MSFMAVLNWVSCRSAWTGQGIRLLLCTAVVRVVESAPRADQSLVFPW